MQELLSNTSNSSLLANLEKNIVLQKIKLKKLDSENENEETREIMEEKKFENGSLYKNSSISLSPSRNYLGTYENTSLSKKIERSSFLFEESSLSTMNEV